ncbi:SGNH/GDSL hydrolase family protein [Sphingobacterium chungjuense]|uniref:SGNH/GDSL hydrolase family protein n=1 Tax=Sphingobacterium chungjuense TaxID=2675553 RepID=UPI001408E895|nr:hypothetical protein [Sphingobacterium chungjuense]
MKDYGCFNFLINGLGGQSSGSARQDLERALKLGIPKYLFWFLGMNDTDPNTYITNVELIRTLCQRNGIELILATVPTVPTRSKEVISQYVRDSGLRYVDFYKAVRTNSSGRWHAGYLHTSESEAVHHTALGAQALASQILIDFPEIMQYGTINTDQVGSVIGDN